MKHPNNQKPRGFALVLVLSFIVLLTILLVVFATVSRLDRSASRNYSQTFRAEELARGALNLIVADFQDEIEAGSDRKITANETVTFRPKDRVSSVPARIGTLVTNEPNLLRKSSGNGEAWTAAFPTTSYTPGDLPPNRASNVPTTTRSVNGRSISAARWAKPGLLENPGSFQVPDWVYVTRSGARATTFSPDLSLSSSPSFVVGRFAYTVYDVSGLIDVNVAGLPTVSGPTADQQKVLTAKGHAAFSDLTAIPGISEAQQDELINWRATVTKTDPIRLADERAIRLGGRDVQNGDNAFLSRQDLLAFAERAGFTNAVPFLTTFSTETNSPSVAPGTDPTRNPDYAALRLNGKPIRRFPLQRLALLESDPSTLTPEQLDEVELLFGLTPAPDATNSRRKWIYRATTIDSPEVAIAANRQPDLFELIRGAIKNPSLGVAVANSGLVLESGGSTYSPEANVHHQVARIVANLADQHDADNFPTTIVMGGTELYGIENLPYFSEMMFKAHLPGGYSGGTGALYTYFELWNPHRGPIPTNGPSRVRIRANSDARVTMNYIQLNGSGPGSPNGQYSRVNSSTPELPPSTSFPVTPIVVNDLPRYQGDPKIVDNASDSATRISALSPEVNGWELLRVNRPVPATWNGLKFTSLATTRLVPVLEFETAEGNWQPYSTFAGHFTPLGTTGIQGGGNPFMNNASSNPGNASFNNRSNAPNISFMKPDPRTFRLRSGVSYSPTYERTMVSTAPSGQYTDQDQSGIAPRYLGMQYRNRGAHSIADIDGILRPGDGYLDDTLGNPMRTGVDTARPVILNRPFRSVGELGYVFRDSPWKSLDFFSGESADTALLDLFSMEETELVAGRINPNTPHPEVLAAVLRGVAVDTVTGNTLSDAAALEIANLITNVSNAPTTRPIQNRSDLPALLSPGTVTPNLPAIKTQREAAVRALAPMLKTRTWNLMIDVIAEAGRFGPSATALGDFIVEGSRRCWLHVAIDRFTGEVVDSRLEFVYE